MGPRVEEVATEAAVLGHTDQSACHWAGLTPCHLVIPPPQGAPLTINSLSSAAAVAEPSVWGCTPSQPCPSLAPLRGPQDPPPHPLIKLQRAKPIPGTGGSINSLPSPSTMNRCAQARSAPIRPPLDAEPLPSSCPHGAPSTAEAS